MDHYLLELDRKFILHGLAQNTRAVYRRCAARFLTWRADRPGEVLCRRDVEDFIVNLAQDRGLANTTQALYCAAIRFLFDEALDRPDVMEGFPRPRITPSQPRVLSHGEVLAIVDAARSPRQRSAILTGYDGGLRVSEATALRWHDVDPERATLTIRSGKGGRPRIVPLSSRLTRTLAEHADQSGTDASWLFPSRANDGALHPRTLNRWLRRAVDSSGVSHIGLTFHTLRHSIATHLLEQGAPVRTIQGLLGHARLENTARYLHLSANSFDQLRGPIEDLAAAR